MIELSFSVSIARPPAEVFSILTDFEAYLARWAKGPVAAAKLGPDPTGPGSRIAITAKIGPLRVHSPYEVLVWEPPQRFGGRGVAGPVRFEEEYRLAGQGTTELAQSIKAWPRGPFRYAQPLIARQLESLLPADLGRLKHLAEDAR
jgi:uncharacterized protein YndB with AHSA1/START domain